MKKSKLAQCILTIMACSALMTMGSTLAMAKESNPLAPSVAAKSTIDEAMRCYNKIVTEVANKI